MSLFEAILLAVVQGLTEFLPVSSSGHLVLTASLLGVQEQTIAFEILVHFGTLLAIFAALWHDIAAVVNSLLRFLAHPSRWRQQYQTDPPLRIAAAIGLGTLPAVAAALLFRSSIEALFRSPAFAGGMLLVTGTILYVGQNRSEGRVQTTELPLRDAIIIGCGQALAILPGISRSGTTISAGLLRGLERTEAARFSFLLTIPAILGATALAIDDVAAGRVETAVWVLAAATLTAAVTGYLAIRLLLQAIRRGKLFYFSLYTWTVGSIILFLEYL